MQRRRFLCASLGMGLLATSAFPVARAGAILRGRQGAGALTPHTGADLAFGTVISIRLLETDSRCAELAIADALAAAKQVDALMSIYRPGSQVHTLNREGELAAPNPHLVKVLDMARRLSERTGGAFDITVQPLWEMAAQGRDGKSVLPLLGWRRVHVDSERVQLAPGMAITLNGIAQGYALDLARAALQAHGIRAALIDTGEFGSLGKSENARPWTLGVRDPRRENGIIATLALDGRSIATSGDYASAFSADFSRHHIFDPATGESPSELAEVTVAAPSGILADGLSTAFMVTGAKRALALAAAMPGVDVLLVGKDGRMQRSAGMPMYAV
jgi:thiamine biosynthesis lipoprotein